MRTTRPLTQQLSVNVTTGEASERQMTTGKHVVRDIFCVRCGELLGWKYVRVTPRRGVPQRISDRELYE